MKNMLVPLVFTTQLLFCGSVRASEVVFPHVASGPHYLTELKITNQESTTAMVELSYFRPNGEATEVFAASSSPVQIAPRSTLLLRLRQPPKDTTGWIRAKSSSTISGILQISYLPSPGISSSTSFDNLELFSAARINGAAADSTRKMAVAICNPSASPLILDLEVFDKEGRALGKVSWSIDGGKQRALYLEELGIPEAHSVEIVSKTGLFAAISVSQNGTEMSANQVNELIEKRFVMQQEKIDLNFAAHQVRVRGRIAVITGDNRVDFLDLIGKTTVASIQTDVIRDWDNVAFHPSRPLVAIAGRAETLVVDLTTFTALKKFALRDAVVAFDDLTETFITGEYINLGLAFGTRITTYDQNFLPIATKSITYGNNAQARGGVLVIATGSGGFRLIALPLMQAIELTGEKSLPPGAVTGKVRISADKIVVFGPDSPYSKPAEFLLTLYYLDSDRFETIGLGESTDTKVVQKERVYLTRNNKLTVVDLLQRRVIFSTLLDFSPKHIDFYIDANALVALDQNSRALWIVKLSAQ